MTARWVMFCEARGDLRTACGLVDRVLRTRGAEWPRDLPDSSPNRCVGQTHARRTEAWKYAPTLIPCDLRRSTPRNNWKQHPTEFDDAPDLDS
jgi:hypothetical protein